MLITMVWGGVALFQAVLEEHNKFMRNYRAAQAAGKF
jgi:hypothetical protein